MMYTPSIEITTPAGRDINIGGSIKYAPWKMLDVDLAMKGATNSPIKVQGKTFKFFKFPVIVFLDELTIL